MCVQIIFVIYIANIIDIQWSICLLAEGGWQLSIEFVKLLYKRQKVVVTLRLQTNMMQYTRGNRWTISYTIANSIYLLK